MAVPFTEAELAEIMKLAAHELATTANAVVLTAEVIRPSDIETFPHSGQIVIGRLHDALGRFWWDVQYRPDEVEFGFVQQYPKRHRLGPLGQILPMEQ